MTDNFLVNFCQSLLATYEPKVHAPRSLKRKTFHSSISHFRLVNFAHPHFRILDVLNAVPLGMRETKN